MTRVESALAGKPMKWLAEKTGISTSVLSDYGKGKTPGSDKAVAIAEALMVDVGWLLTGHGQGYSAEADDEDTVELDSIDLSFGLGGTFLDVGDPNIERVKFSRNWLRKFTHSPPEVLGSTEGNGDSMEPVIYDRDIVIFDRSARIEDHLSDKMWVFAFGQIGMIKRLRPLPDGTVKIMSANRTYPDETATWAEIHIVGRVVATVRRH